MIKGNFENTWLLMKFMLKRERVSSTAWVLSIVIFNFLIVLLLSQALMPAEADRAALMEMFENPALLAMVGPLHPELGSGYSGQGYVYTLFMMVFVGIAVAIMNVFLVVRHTRADEEAGRYEVLRSLPCGRLANVNAAMLCALIINAALAVLIAVSMWLGVSIGEYGVRDFGSALIWGVNMGVIGLVFAAIAALFSQLSSNARGASSYSFFALGLFYMLRAAADMNVQGELEALAWVSPFGLISRTWPYVPAEHGGNAWWPVLVILGISALLTALAYWTCSKRDIDQGIIPARPGKPRGGLLMRSPLGLNFKLTRLSIIVWVIILLLAAAAYGTILEDIDDFVAGNEMYRNLMLGPVPGMMGQIEALEELEQAGRLTREQVYATFGAIPGMSERLAEINWDGGAMSAVVAALMNSFLEAQGFNVIQMFANMTGFIMAVIATVPVLMFVLRAKAEERAIRAELIFATAASRTKYLAGLVGIAFATAVLVQVAQALGYYALAVSMGITDRLPLSFLMEASLVYVPGIWVMGGLAALLVGLAPKLTGWIWAYYAFGLFAMMYGRMLPELSALANFTPMGWVPSLPVDEINWPVLITLAAIGFALAALGLLFYRRRDINAVTH